MKEIVRLTYLVFTILGLALLAFYFVNESCLADVKDLKAQVERLKQANYTCLKFVEGCL